MRANRFIMANKTGSPAISGKILKDESPEVLSQAHDMADPRVWGANGEISEASYTYTVDCLLKVGFMTESVAYDRFFERCVLDRVLPELGRQ